MIVVRDKRGNERLITQKNWDLLKNEKSTDTERKGWTFIRYATEEDLKNNGIKKVAEFQGKAPLQQAAPLAATFIPDEIREAKDQPQSSGAASSEPAQQPEQGATPADKPESDEPAADDFMKIEGMNKTVVEALVSNGITTFKQLSETDTPVLAGILGAAGQGPKKGQVPSWRSKAAELSKTASK